MEKITLTEQEKELIKRHLHYEIGYGVPDNEPIARYTLVLTEEERKVMDGIVERAENLEDELDAIDEVMDVQDCDIVLWYYLKYCQQEGVEP